ncbi:MAG: CHASE domain-containing protein [Chloroflexota bacterium]
MNQTKQDDTAMPHPSLRGRVIIFLRGTTPRKLWLALGLLVFALGGTALAALYVRADAEAAGQREFDFVCNDIQLHIASRMNASAQLLHGAAGLFDASETVTREEWRAFTQQLQIEEQLPGIQGIGFALLIPPEQLDQHIQEIRSEGFPDYSVTPAGIRETYSSIIFLEPFSDRNLRAFGYDMFSEPIRRAAMEQARDQNIVVLSGKVILVQETGQDVQAGTLMYLPVYRHGLPLETVEQRRAAILGCLRHLLEQRWHQPRWRRTNAGGPAARQTRTVLHQPWRYRPFQHDRRDTTVHFCQLRRAAAYLVQRWCERIPAVLPGPALDVRGVCHDGRQRARRCYHEF